MRGPPSRERRRFSDAVDVLEPFRYGAPFPNAITRGREPSASRPFLLDRDRIRIATPWRDPFKNEVTVINRRIANGLISSSRKPELMSGAGKSAISVPRPFVLAAARPRKPVVSAKAIAADRRFQNFSSFPKNLNGTFASIVPKHNGRVRFLLPWQVLPCVQRTTRREVLFAKRRAGGASSRSPKRRGPHSNIGC